MSKAASKTAVKKKYQQANRTAGKDFQFTDELVAGIVLNGNEVKAVRAGKLNLTGSYGRMLVDVKSKKPELWLVGANIAESVNNSWKLLVTAKQLDELIGQTARKQQTLVARRAFFERGFLKIALGIGKRKQEHDRRAELRARSLQREAERSL